MASSGFVPVTDAERQALAQHDAVIDRALEAFVDMRDALLAIQNERLYRRDYESVEARWRDRWQIPESAPMK